MLLDLDTALGGLHSYCAVPRTMQVVLTNLTNLEAVFKWTNYQEPEYRVTFFPAEGHIAGKGLQEIEVTLEGLAPGKFNQIFGCTIEGAELSLPFKLMSTVHDLEVSYHVFTPAEALARDDTTVGFSDLPVAVYNKSRESNTFSSIKIKNALKLKRDMAELDKK
jgi:hypothetical protein